MSKKLILGIFMVSLLTVISAVRSYAQGIQVGLVQGFISNPDSSAANGASVSVLCNGVTENDTTDSSGFYSVQFADGVCSTGMTATVNASKDGLNGVNAGTMNNFGGNAVLSLDVAIIHVPLVPEFGLLTGAGAMVASIGSFAVLRRKRTD